MFKKIKILLFGKSIIDLEEERMKWSLKTFPEATPVSSLRKLEAEIKEVEAEIVANKERVLVSNIHEEYADCLMCLFDSAGRYGIRPGVIFKAFEEKMKRNQARNWVKNSDNSYSHVK